MSTQNLQFVRKKSVFCTFGKRRCCSVSRKDVTSVRPWKVRFEPGSCICVRLGQFSPQRTGVDRLCPPQGSVSTASFGRRCSSFALKRARACAHVIGEVGEQKPPRIGSFGKAPIFRSPNC